jgi:hypothetical protein
MEAEYARAKVTTLAMSIPAVVCHKTEVAYDMINLGHQAVKFPVTLWCHIQCQEGTLLIVAGSRGQLWAQDEIMQELEIFKLSA